MKHLKLTLLSVTGFAFSSLIAQTVIPSTSVQSTTPATIAEIKISVSGDSTLDGIIAKHVAAIGGADAWRKVSSIREEGTMKVQGANVSIVRTVLHQKGLRMDITFGGVSGYQIMTNTAGWNYLPFQGQTQPEPSTEEDIKEGQSDLDAQDELIDYKEKGSTVELAGKDDVEGTECFKLLVTFKSGKTETLFIDPASYHIIRQVAKQKANGQEMEITVNLSNYQKLPEGIVVAMSIGEPFGELNVTKVEVNKTVDEAIFKPSK
jgi:hypothetical protein